jgi:hypothetical protein
MLADEKLQCQIRGWVYRTDLATTGGRLVRYDCSLEGALEYLRRRSHDRSLRALHEVVGGRTVRVEDGEVLEHWGDLSRVDERGEPIVAFLWGLPGKQVRTCARCGSARRGGGHYYQRNEGLICLHCELLERFPDYPKGS